LPAWSAAITHVPTPVMVTVDAVMVHGPEATLKVTGSPELALADTVNGPAPYACGPGSAKVMVWDCTAGSTVCTTVPLLGSRTVPPLESPVKDTEMVCVPTGSAEVVQDPSPALFSATDAQPENPPENESVPSPVVGSTVAVKVTAWPTTLVLSSETTVVVVAMIGVMVTSGAPGVSVVIDVCSADAGQ